MKWLYQRRWRRKTRTTIRWDLPLAKDHCNLLPFSLQKLHKSPKNAKCHLPCTRNKWPCNLKIQCLAEFYRQNPLKMLIRTLQARVNTATKCQKSIRAWWNIVIQEKPSKFDLSQGLKHTISVKLCTETNPHSPNNQWRMLSLQKLLPVTLKELKFQSLLICNRRCLLTTRSQETGWQVGILNLTVLTLWAPKTTPFRLGLTIIIIDIDLKYYFMRDLKVNNHFK